MTLSNLFMAAQVSGISQDLYQSFKKNQTAVYQGLGQAAGVYNTLSANRLTRLGTTLDKQSLELQRIQQEVSSSEESLEATKHLNQVQSLQRALAATRGQTGGSIGALGNVSQNLANADERARRLSLTFNQQQITNQQRLLSIQGAAKEASNYGNLFAQTIADLGSLFPTAPSTKLKGKGYNVSAGKTDHITFF